MYFASIRNLFNCCSLVHVLFTSRSGQALNKKRTAAKPVAFCKRNHRGQHSLIWVVTKRDTLCGNVELNKNAKHINRSVYAQNKGEMFPALLALNPALLTGVINEYDDVVNAIYNQSLVDVQFKFNNLSLSGHQLESLRKLIYQVGHRETVLWFLTTYDQRFDRTNPGDYSVTEDMCKHATAQWWTSRWRYADLPQLTFAKDDEGFVTVDLWHTARGTARLEPPGRFSKFKSGKATFFLGSKGQVYKHLDSLKDYIDEAEHGEENVVLYVKRGRFRFKPLLWFDDKKVDELRENTEKAHVVAKLVNLHPNVKEDFDLMKEDDATWMRMLYSKKEIVVSGEKRQKVSYRHELRLDNNCVDDNAKIPIDAGFHGTLTVDVSGFGGATGPPGSVPPETKSVVIWDVPKVLVEEGPWEMLPGVE